jgi:N-acetylmuramoyl-L-alanine amidase
MNYNISAGHNESGKRFCGAVGHIEESIENRKIKDELIKFLKDESLTVNDTTVNDGISQSDILNRCIKQCNQKPGLNIQIHLNASKPSESDGKNKGVECIVYSKNNNPVESRAYTEAKRICDNIAKLGFTNRGVKVNNRLAFLNDTISPAIIIECFFCDDMDDVKLYQQIGEKEIAKAITEGIIGRKVTVPKKVEENKVETCNVKLTVLKKGMNNYKEIVILQELLIIYGFAIKCDGMFGPKTEQAVKEFQTIKKLKVTGIVEEKTWQEFLG